MSAGGLARLGVRCASPATGMATLGVFCDLAATGSGGLAPGRKESKEIRLDTLSRQLSVHVPRIPFVESAEGVQKEIDRFELAKTLAEAQILLAEQELILLQAKIDLDAQIKAEILLISLIEARKFLEDVIMELFELRMRKRRREDEEILFGIAMAGIGEINVTIH